MKDLGESSKNKDGVVGLFGIFDQCFNPVVIST